MKLKLLALAGIMAASMGLTACDSNKENAAEDLSDAQEEVQDAKEELAETPEATPEADAAVAQAEADIADAQVATATDEIDAEVPVDGTTTSVDVASDTEAANAADDVVVVEEPAQ